MRLPHRLLLIVVTTAIIPLRSAAAPLGEPSPALQQLRAARDAAQAFTLDFENDLTAKQGHALEALKDSFVSFLVEHMSNVPPDRKPSARAIEADLRAAIGDDGSSTTHPSEPTRFAESVTFEVSVPSKVRNLVAIKTSFNISCGEDALLVVFEAIDRHWVPVIVWRSPSYVSIGEAFEGLSYAVSPTGADGRWYVLVSSAPAWCTSCWSSRRFAVLKPAPGTSRSEPKFSDAASYYRCESPLTVQAKPTRFELRLDGSSLDSDTLMRTHVLAYQFDGDTVRRIPPVAESAKDFVDEWVTSPWAEAERWSSAARRSQLKAAHDTLTERLKTMSVHLRRNAKASTRSTDIVELREVDSDSDTTPHTWRFEVTRARGTFLLQKITESPSHS